MEPSTLLIGSFVASFLYFYLPYLATDGFTKNALSKYIPPMLSATTILILSIKLRFFQVGYSGVLDVILIMVFSITFTVHLAAGLLLQYRQKRYR